MDTIFKITMAAARTNANLSQQEMAERLGMSRGSYIRLEQGKDIIKLDLAILFAQITGIPFQYINFFSHEHQLKVEKSKSDQIAEL